jgi:hypothetical protein
MNIHDAISFLWSNHPSSASTFSQCGCGRTGRRGSNPCDRCISDMIVGTSKVNSLSVYDLLEAIRTVRELEARLIKLVGDDDMEVPR